MLTKEEILKEIKRTTKENSGKPLGQKNFKNETGIRSWDWGQYWPRYGDALIEAGFSPNKKWTAYQTDFLVEKIIVLIRKLGKYPTIGEMRIEHLNNPEFPYHAIDKKLKQDFLRNVVNYCKEKTDYKDIIALCEPLLENFDSKEAVNKTKTSIGEVYLLKHDNDYKIGKTNNIVRRGSEIRLQLPNDLVLIHSIKTDDPDGIEKYWHQRFADKNTRGEWFKLNKRDIETFKKWKRIC